MTISTMIITMATTPRNNIHSLRFTTVLLEDDERSVAAWHDRVQHAGRYDEHPAGIDGHGNAGGAASTLRRVGSQVGRGVAFLLVTFGARQR